MLAYIQRSALSRRPIAAWESGWSIEGAGVWKRTARPDSLAGHHPFVQAFASSVCQSRSPPTLYTLSFPTKQINNQFFNRKFQSYAFPPVEALISFEAVCKIKQLRKNGERENSYNLPR